MAVRRGIVSLLLLAALAAPGLLQAAPTHEEEAQGTCRTPRQAWLQLLYWAGLRRDHARAAACFDTSELRNPDSTAPELARRLLDRLDAEQRFIDVEAPAAADPEHVDPETGRHEYRDPAAPEVVIVKQPDGRWLFSAESLALVDRSGEPAIRSPGSGWLYAEFLGVFVWSYLGLAALLLVAAIALAVTALLLRRLGRAGSPVPLRRLGRAAFPLGTLPAIAVLYLGFPLLLMPPGASRVALVVLKVALALSLLWTGYRVFRVPRSG